MGDIVGNLVGNFVGRLLVSKVVKLTEEDGTELVVRLAIGDTI